MRLTILGRAFMAGAVTLISACGSSGTSSKSATSGAAPVSSAPVTIATTLQLSSLDGIAENLVPVNDTIYDTLVKIDGSGGTQADLATKWAANAAGTQWTFTLRNGVRFSNGTSLTAADVVYSYEQVKADAKSMNHSYLAQMASVSGSGDQVVFNLTQPFASWPRQTTLIPIVSEAAYKQEGPTAFASKPVGSGPYEVKSFVAGQSVVLAPNPDYWGTPPVLKNVTEEEVASETTRLTGLQSGSIDAAILSPAVAQTARSDSKLQVQTVPSDQVTYLGFNSTSTGTSSLAFRQAVSDAVNRQAIANALFAGDATPIGQLLAPSVFGYDPSIKPTSFDPTKAKALVAQSGYKGQTIPFTYLSGPSVPRAAQIAQAVQSYLKAVGINVALRSEPQATFITDWFSKQLTGMWLFSIQPSTLDAALVFDLTAVATAEFTDPVISQAYTSQASQTNVAQRKATLVSISNEINSKVWFAPLLNDDNVYVSNRSALSVTPRADGDLLPQYMR